MIDYYEVLEISPNVSTEVLQKAYHTAIAKYSPDKFHSHYKQYATQHIKRINEAYQVLADPIQRRRYDVRLSASTRLTPTKANQTARILLKILSIGFLVMVTLNFMKFIVLLPAFKIIAPLVLAAALLGVGIYQYRKSKSQHPGGGIHR